NPPYSFGMIMPKNLLARIKSQTPPGRSLSSQLIRQSSNMPQRRSVGPERKSLSADESAAAGVARSLDQFGLPEKRSASHQTSPASSASRSVSDMEGSALRAQPKIGRDSKSRRNENRLMQSLLPYASFPS